MTYQKFITDPMPKYSKGEEIFNYVSHIVGGSLGILLIIFSSICYFNYDIEKINFISILIFGIAIIILYTISTLYHALKKDSISKRIFRILDHCTIYLLIAGTYTPICLIAFSDNIFGILLLIIEWILAIVGIILKISDLNNKYIKIISTTLYAVMGWGLMIFPHLIPLLSLYQFMMILSGGIFYTVGIIFFVLGKNKKWFHSIFHIFCCIGTILQLFGVFNIFLS